ncbi:polysaccharide deacetylase family protein [Flaviflagellibacter deserti]|uniref:Chitooligosaccharide deacetylase n=1 Tax=Flaviflagellibacter deserti TaxID=2267266 RepID=A0ABV9Z1J4_9HYPH
MDLRTGLLRLGLNAIDAAGALGITRLLARLTRGSGLIFTLHHVRPAREKRFDPNGILEITPEFLDTAIVAMKEAGYDVVTLGDALQRLQEKDQRRFAVFTFDDGARDVRDHALPVLRKHDAPCTMFIASGFADGTAELWWLVLEETLRRRSSLAYDFGGGPEQIALVSDAEKNAVWNRIYWHLRSIADEKTMRAIISRMAQDSGFDGLSLTREVCMDWSELRAVAADPLVEIGNHTVSHPMLAKATEQDVRDELTTSQRRITEELGVTPRHLAYPVGDPTSAGPREFRIARELGFASGLTTRKGVLFPEHGTYPTALPRISLNGNYQERRYLELFASGLPFALQNRFRRLDVA